MGQDATEHGVPPSPRQVHVEQDDIGQPFIDQLNGSLRLVGFAHHIDGLAELGPDAGPEDGMVLHQEDPGPAARGSAPAPGSVAVT